MDAAFFQNLEEQLLDPEIRKDEQMLCDLLAEDFMEFASSGREYDRKQVIAALLDEPPAKRLLLDFSAKELGAEAVLVTYRSIRQHSEASIGRQSLRSSIWVLQAGRWRMAFHQGTLIGQ